MNSTILLWNPQPSERGDWFWGRVVQRLGEDGIELAVAGRHPLRQGVRLLPAAFSLPIGARLKSRIEVPEDVIDQAVAAQSRFHGRALTGNRWRLAAESAYVANLLMLASVRPAACVFCNGFFPQQVLAREVCRRLHIPVLFTEKAPIPGFLYLDPDGLMGDSRFAKTLREDHAYSNAGVRTNRARIVERKLIESRSTWWGQKTSSGGGNVFGDSQRRVLFAGQVDRDSQNFYFSPHFDSNVDAARTFSELLAGRPGVEVVGKHHPKSDVPVERFRSVFGGGGVWRDDVDVNDALEQSTHVAAVNSGVLFEALLRAKPALSMGRTLLSGLGVFYEWRPGADHVIDEWLNAEGWEDRLSRWHIIFERLLSEDFYSMDPENSTETTLLGPDDMARRLRTVAGDRGGVLTPDVIDAVTAAWEHLSRPGARVHLSRAVRGMIGAWRRSRVPVR